MIRKYCKFILNCSSFLFIIFFSIISVSANSMNVTLITPQNNEIFNTTNNISFVCNTTSDQYIKNISLYHNLNGSFVLNQTNYFGELETDSSTLFLMHFNNDSSIGENDTFVYDWSGNEKNGLVYGVKFNSTIGKFFGSFEFNATNQDYIEISHSSELNLANGGSIEFWLKSISSSKARYVLFKGTGIDSLTSPYTFFLYDNTNQFCLRLTEQTGSYYNDFCSQGGLDLNTWYHIVATWNSTEAKLYVNSLLNGTYTMYSGDFPLLESSYSISIGKTEGNPTWYSYYNGTIDELIMYNRMLTLDEIQGHYQRNLIKNTTQNWTINNILDGSYKWNCFSNAYELLNAWGNANYTFHIDTLTPPTINEIILSPSSEDDIDPGVIINITANVTDISNVSTVIFQWKEVGDWNSTIMNYNELRGLYENASVSIDITGGIYYYRIWSNDTNDNSGYSNTENISALWDYTWDRNPSNFTISGVIDSYASTFLTINNTGDDTLNFTLSHNWIRDVYFNGSLDTFSFSLDKGKESVINVTMHFLIYTSELEAEIIINASHPSENPSPESLVITAVINSYVGGSYFDLDIVDHPSTISQSGSTNLTARVKNIGNETATNVWLNWTLPTGWSNTSGNLNHYLENITTGSSKWSIILVTLDPSTAITGIVTLYVNVSCNENISSADSKIIGVNCNSTDGICGYGCTYATDSNCPIPSGPSGASPGETPIAYVSTEEETLLLYTEENIELVRGLNNTFVLEIVNPSESEDFMNVSLNVSGYLSQYIGIEPTFVYRINKNQTKEFMIFIEAPKYFTKGKYVLSFTISGISKGKRITENKLLTLYVHEVSREEAIEYLNQSQNILNEMRDAGFNTKKILELITKINGYFEERNYEDVKETYDEIKKIRDNAFQVLYLLEKVEKEINENEERGLKVSSTKNLFTMSKAAFIRGDFITALKRIEDSQNILSLETSGKINYIKLALDYWWAIFLGITISSITGYFVKTRLEILKATDILRNLRFEEISITDKIREIKEKTFKQNLMSMADYHKVMYDYQKRSTDIKKEMAKIRSRRSGLNRIKTEIKNLEDEKRSIEKLIEETQMSYFQREEINKSTYDNKMNSLTESLTEIEKNIGMLKLQQENKGSE